jgi:FMN-dependent oxidoreductase (nitrilotriacetate monooxygenase family)
MIELEPTMLLPALAMVTSHIGLVTTASTTYNEPYNLARRFATLDLISKGRAGWNVVASWSEHEAQNFGLETTLDYDTRYARSAEFVDVVKGLWDGWDDGALLLDKAGGRYFDEAKMHVLNHHGRFFKVRGPLSVACMPQGHPVIVQAGASEQGRELGAATADVIYAINGSLDAARAYYDDVKGRMAKYGREPDELKIMPAFCPVLGRTRAEAQAKFDQFQELVDPLAGLGSLYPVVWRAFRLVRSDGSRVPPTRPIGKLEIRSMRRSTARAVSPWVDNRRLTVVGKGARKSRELSPGWGAARRTDGDQHRQSRRPARGDQGREARQELLLHVPVAVPDRSHGARRQGRLSQGQSRVAEQHRLALREGDGERLSHARPRSRSSIRCCAPIPKASRGSSSASRGTRRSITSPAS